MRTVSIGAVCNVIFTAVLCVACEEPARCNLQRSTEEDALDVERLASIAVEAGEIVLGLFEGVPAAVDTKESDLELVTEADLRSEQFILRELKDDYPECGFLAEESSPEEAKDLCRLIVDPLDGTTNFASGIPHFAVSIALEEEGEVVAGVVYDPIRMELFCGAIGRGATLNGQRIQVSEESSIERAILETGFHPGRQRVSALEDLETLYRVASRSRDVRRLGSAALAMSYVAAGRLTGYWEEGPRAWDAAAAGLIVREAGGVTTGLRGGPWDLESGQFLVTNGKIHPKMLELLRTER